MEEDRRGGHQLEGLTTILQWEEVIIAGQIGQMQGPILMEDQTQESETIQVREQILFQIGEQLSLKLDLSQGTCRIRKQGEIGIQLKVQPGEEELVHLVLNEEKHILRIWEATQVIEGRRQWPGHWTPILVSINLSREMLQLTGTDLDLVLEVSIDQTQIGEFKIPPQIIVDLRGDQTSTVMWDQGFIKGLRVLLRRARRDQPQAIERQELLGSMELIEVPSPLKREWNPITKEKVREGETLQKDLQFLRDSMERRSQ